MKFQVCFKSSETGSRHKTDVTAETGMVDNPIIFYSEFQNLFSEAIFEDFRLFDQIRSTFSSIFVVFSPIPSFHRRFAPFSPSSILPPYRNFMGHHHHYGPTPAKSKSTRPIVWKTHMFLRVDFDLAGVLYGSSIK